MTTTTQTTEIALMLVDESDTFAMGISMNQLAERVQWGALKQDGWWYPIVAGKIVDHEFQHNTGATGFAMARASHVGITLVYP